MSLFSIAGLWAARICADHFDKVVIIENEKWLLTDEGTLPICDEKGNMYNREGKHERTRVFQADALHGLIFALTLHTTRRVNGVSIVSIPEYQLYRTSQGLPRY